MLMQSQVERQIQYLIRKVSDEIEVFARAPYLVDQAKRYRAQRKPQRERDVVLGARI